MVNDFCLCRIKNFSRKLVSIFCLFFLSLVFPAILLSVASIVGQSEVLEEIIKGLIVFLIVCKLSGKKKKILAVVTVGILIGFSESFFYLSYFSQNFNTSNFFEKIFFSVSLHILTLVFILLISFRSKWLILPGVAASIVFHLFFNNYFIYWF